MYSRCGKPSANARSPSLVVANPGRRKRAPYALAPCARACVLRTGPSLDTGMRPVVSAGAGALGAPADIDVDTDVDTEAGGDAIGDAPGLEATATGSTGTTD